MKYVSNFEGGKKMGYASMISDDIIDKGHANGMNTGWSSISPKIKYSSKESKMLSNLGFSETTEIKDIANIVFLKQDSHVEECGKVEIIHKWKYITENRINFLLRLKRNISFEGAKISIDASLSELDDAYNNILGILKYEPDLCDVNIKEASLDNDYPQVFCKELVLRLIEYLKYVDEDELFKNIITDLKYLIAVILDSKNEDDEFVCAIVHYVEYLKSLGLSYDDQECVECGIDTVFDEYKHCLVCGKRRP